MTCVGHILLIEEMRNSFNIMFRKTGGNGPLRKPRHRGEYNITMDVYELGLEGLAFIHSAEDGNR
jgi:hypothetical protein